MILTFAFSITLTQTLSFLGDTLINQKILLSVHVPVNVRVCQQRMPNFQFTDFDQFYIGTTDVNDLELII